MRDNMDHLEDDTKEILSDLNQRVRRVETALLGDQKMGSRGFIERYKETEEQVEQNTKKIDKIWYYAVAIGGTVVVVFEVFKAII